MRAGLHHGTLHRLAPCRRATGGCSLHMRTHLDPKLPSSLVWPRLQDDPTFFPGRHASVLFRGERVGQFGIIHPEVLAAFDIVNPGGYGIEGGRAGCMSQHARTLACCSCCCNKVRPLAMLLLSERPDP